MKIGIASDHGGYELKEELKDFIKSLNHEPVDYGTDSKDSVDYPDYAQSLCDGYLKGDFDLGIAICGTGVGMSIACNKIKGIRAAHCTDSYTAKVIREHNNANIMCMGARITGIEIAKEIVENFLKADFQEGRHQKRVEKITKMEEN